MRVNKKKKHMLNNHKYNVYGYKEFEFVRFGTEEAIRNTLSRAFD